jgi:hypothetical protein
MASEGPPQSEEIVCVRVPCRDGRERVWRAIELLHQEQRQQQPLPTTDIPETAQHDGKHQQREDRIHGRSLLRVEGKLV